MSTERVDVLAVMDEAAEASRFRAESISGAAWIHQKSYDEMVKARAAVAELIEAAEQCMTSLTPDWIRLSDALARIDAP